MANLWQRLFHRVTVVSLKLDFVLDRDSDGRHLVRIRKSYDDRTEDVTDVRPLFRYGYQEESPDRRQVNKLSVEDWQTLQSIRSLNPEFAQDGALIFDVLPPVLSYLRQKPNVEEQPASQEVTVSKTPLRPALTVEFDPDGGVDLKPGYRDGNDAEFIPPEQLKTMPDGRWARWGNHFVSLPKTLTPVQEALFRQGGHHVPLQHVPEFFQRDLVLYQSEFSAVLTDLAAQVRIVQEPLKPLFHLDQSEPGWLDFKVEYQNDEVSLRQDQLVEVGRQKYIRLTPTTWLKLHKKTVDEARAIKAEAEGLGGIPTVDGYRVPAHAFASLEEFIQEIGGQTVVSEAYQRFLDQLMGFRANDAFRLSDAAENDLARINVRLRPYQRSGIHWLDWLANNGLHGVLADDMGLGKTLQAIAALRWGYERTNSRQPSLIVAPKSVLYHWERELARYFPGMPRLVYHGTGRQPSLLQANQPIIFITTYATVTNDLDTFVRTPLFYLVLDEATAIKNPTALRTNAMKALNASHRLALTGTPVENRPAELWSLFDFLMRGHLGHRTTFQQHFEAPIMAGNLAASEKLGRRIKPFMLRRLKSEVARDLPDKVELQEWCELTDEQRGYYAELQDKANRLTELLRTGELINYTMSILPVLTRLLQLCDHPAIIAKQQAPLMGRSEKYDWVVEKIEEILDGGEQVVVFSRFLEMLTLLEHAMQERSIPYIRIDGSTNCRQALIDNFNDGKSRVALCSPLAAGHGVNLTSANHVIHADRWWNPAVEDQATDRVHRIGQNRTVYVHRIIVGGTLEERIDKLLTSKRGLARQIMDAAGGPMGGWTREELIELLAPFG